MDTHRRRRGVCRSRQGILDRVKELAELFQMPPKSKDMRVLNYLGVYHLPAFAKFSFVYEFPRLQQEEKDLEPVSLADFIQDTKPADRNPTLNESLLCHRLSRLAFLVFILPDGPISRSAHPVSSTSASEVRI